MSEPDNDRYHFIHDQLHQKEARKEKIAAAELEGEVVKNLKLLKALIQSEKVKINVTDSPFTTANATSPVEKIQAKIIEELYSLNIAQLALFEVPKKFFDECFELLISAWRRRIHQSFPQTLTLEYIPFSKSSFRAFVIALSLNVSLKALRLDNCLLKPYEMKLLAVFIKVHPSLVFLHLDHNAILDEGLYSISAALKDNETIEHLSLINTQITDEGALSLCHLIERKKLKTLHLDKNKLTEKSILPLQELFFKTDGVLTFDEL